MAKKTTSTTKRRSVTVSPKLLKARKLQGRYMSAIRGLKQKDLARVKKLVSEQGAPAGLKLALSLKKK